MNPSADLQFKSWARYGLVLGRAAANVIHEVNAPLGVALARVQLALRLLDELPTEHTLALDEQLRGCEAAIRSSASVIRDLNYLRRDLVTTDDTSSAAQVLNAAYQLALLDASLAGCKLTVQASAEDIQLPGDPHHLLVLLLELIWDWVRRGATRLSLTLQKCSYRGQPLTSIVLMSDELGRCEESTKGWVELLAGLCNARIAWRPDGTDVACVISLGVNSNMKPLLQGTV